MYRTIETIFVSIHILTSSSWFRFIIISLANRLSVQSSHDKHRVLPSSKDNSFHHEDGETDEGYAKEGHHYLLTECNQIWGCFLSIYKQHKKLLFVFSLIDDNFVFIRLLRFVDSLHFDRKMIPFCWHHFGSRLINYNQFLSHFFPRWLVVVNLIDSDQVPPRSIYY